MSFKERAKPYELSREGVPMARVATLLFFWPVFAFKFLRRGRFATIAELRRVSAVRKAAHKYGAFSESDNDGEGSQEAPESSLQAVASMVDPKTALSWALFLSLVFLAHHFVPSLGGVISLVMISGAFVAIVVALTSITVEPSAASGKKPAPDAFARATEALGGVFFVLSTFPFALPWILAYFFPRECLLFFTVWAAFGAIIGEISVLVAHKAAKRDAMDAIESRDQLLKTTGERPTLERRRARKNTAQRLATVSNFTSEDKLDLEEYLVSDDGLRWWAAFLGMQGTISAIGVFLTLGVELWLVDVPGREMLTVFLLMMSTCMHLESYWMTYAVGGRWLHFKQNWRFFQPFKGGKSFVSIQFPSWLLFFLSLVLAARDLRPSMKSSMEALGPDVVSPWGAHFINETLLGTMDRLGNLVGLQYLPRGSAAIMGVFAELLQLVALPLFEGDIDNKYLTEPLKREVVVEASEQAERSLVERENRLSRARIKSNLAVPLWEIVADAARTAWLSPIVLAITKPEVVLFLSGFLLSRCVHGTVVPFFEIKLHLPTLMIIVETVYISTFFGAPLRTGRRRWWSIRGGWVYQELAAYFHMHIIREKELSPKERHLFGYMPHGMFPMGAMWIHNTPQWISLFPDIVCYTLVATVTHLVPLLRDVTQYNGGLEASNRSFTKALEKFRNVMLVPGGQHEMLLTSDDPSDCMISTKHKGFIRLALQGAAEKPDDPVNVVPLFAFGEPDMLWNAFPASIKMQRWLVSKLRLNPAFLPVGRFNLAGVPNRSPITFVVAPPIRVPVVKGIPTEAQIDLLHARFYSGVKESFERNKKIVDGFERAHLRFVPELQTTISQEEFEAKWAEVAEDSGGDLSTLPHKADPTPTAELLVALIFGNLSWFVPYYFFAD